MLIKRIHKAFRGEGKTNWLVENAIDASIIVRDNVADGNESVPLFYVGSLNRYDNFCRVYENTMHHKCQIPIWDLSSMEGCHYAILFTDDLMDEFEYLPKNLPEGGLWYITMSAEDFTNN